jgi:hypothetical protein
MVCFFDATEYATAYSPSCQLFVVSAMKKTLKRLVWLAAILLGAWWIFHSAKNTFDDGSHSGIMLKPRYGSDATTATRQ